MASELTQIQKAHMEAIIGPDSEPFEAFLLDQRESSQEKDSEAKLMFNMMKQMHSESIAIKLAHYLGPSHDIDTRELCAELLGKFLIADDDDLCTWRNISVSTQSTIKCILLDRMKLEQESEFIIQELREIVIKLAASLLPDNNWPELLPFLCQCVSTDSSSNNHLRQPAFIIFAQLAEDIGESIVPFIETLRSPFRKALNDDTLELFVRTVVLAVL